MAWTLRLPADLEEALVERCAATGASKSGLVVLAVRAYLFGLGGVSRPEVKPELLSGDSVVAEQKPSGPSRLPSGGKEFKGPDPRGGKP